ncbi:hypothetical protein B0T16DRAFT_246550 [Cercophora newfieldiana]|uniref:Uncharacterized protein n=1 Tax=Cercophora newfieldiana TaxID=92897 RepID=A0AA39XSW1_9PEZI|nr:hypothetical protein B0T16DRAFT_246550 [Cercophora newfieldiana]
MDDVRSGTRRKGCFGSAMADYILPILRLGMCRLCRVLTDLLGDSTRQIFVGEIGADPRSRVPSSCTTKPPGRGSDLAWPRKHSSLCSETNEIPCGVAIGCRHHHYHCSSFVTCGQKASRPSPDVTGHGHRPVLVLAGGGRSTGPSSKTDLV